MSLDRDVKALEITGISDRHAFHGDWKQHNVRPRHAQLTPT
jgi:hypothetical protein